MGTLIMVSVVVFFFYWIILHIRRAKKVGKQAIDTSHLPEQFVVFDLETTGLDANKHEIIEIAAIKFIRGVTPYQTLQGLVKPSRHLPKKIVELTGITDDMLEKDGSPVHEAIEEFAKFSGNLRLVSFNADFDMAFLHQATSRCGLPKFGNPVSCALKMARRAWPKRKSYRLVDLSKDAEIDEGKAHRALEDARRTLLIYAAAVAELKSIA
jgi:DNA polymerase III epsilon subunit family exonuclease